MPFSHLIGVGLRIVRYVECIDFHVPELLVLVAYNIWLYSGTRTEFEGPLTFHHPACSLEI
jgi:hypothetical protein